MAPRRLAYALIPVGLTSALVAGCTTTGTPDATEGPVTLVVSNWTGYYPEDLAEQFEAATGIQLEIVEHATNEEIVAKLTTSADPGIDVAFVSGQYAQALAEAGLLAELDKSLIPNEANLYPEALDLAYDPGNVYSEPYAWGTTGLCYRTDVLSTSPGSWADLLTPPAEAEGKVTALSTDRWLALPALKLAGESVNTTDPAVLDAAAATLIDAKQHLLAYDDVTFYEKLISGEAVLVEAWDGWCEYARDSAAIDFVIPSEGSDLWTDTMVVLESSEHQAEAQEFINFILDADNHRWVVENILYKVPNQAAMESLDPALIEGYPTLGIDIDTLFAQEPIVDVGDAATLWADLNAKVLAAN